MATMVRQKNLISQQLLILLLILVAIPALGLLQITGFAGAAQGSQGLDLNFLVLGVVIIFAIMLLGKLNPVAAPIAPAGGGQKKLLWIGIIIAVAVVISILSAIFLMGGVNVNVGGGGAKEAAKFYSFDTTSMNYMQMSENVRKFLLVNDQASALLSGEVNWISEANSVRVLRLKSAPGVAVLEAALGYTYDSANLTTSTQGVLIHGQQKFIPIVNEPKPGDVASTSQGARTLAQKVCYSGDIQSAGESCDYGTPNAAVDDSYYASGSSGFTACTAGSSTCQITIDLGTVRTNLDEIDTYLWDFDNQQYDTARYYYGYLIDVSTDGVNWNRVVNKLDTYVSGRQVDMIAPIDVRYIRYAGEGNTKNEGFHIVEVDAFQAQMIKTPTPTTPEMDESLTGYAIIDDKYLLIGSVTDLKKSISIYKSGVGTFETKFSTYAGAVPVSDMYYVTTSGNGGAYIISVTVKSEYVLNAEVAVEKVGDYLTSVNSLESSLLKDAIKYTKKDNGNFVVFTITEISPSKLPMYSGPVYSGSFSMHL